MTNTKCPSCGQTFGDVQAMRQHFNDAHRKAPAVAFSDRETPDSTLDGSLPAERCENCRYWGKSNNLTSCRRHPGTAAMVPDPRNPGALTCITLYPPCFANEWCGEWKAREWPPAGGGGAGGTGITQLS